MTAASDDFFNTSDQRQKAVAIEYDRDSDDAPRITASGTGHIAEQILALAFANGVKVREDADLVEILSVLEVDSVIPLEAYAAVGEILSYVYRVNTGKHGVKITAPDQTGSENKNNETNDLA